jgi:thiamine monophosphate synthase
MQENCSNHLKKDSFCKEHSYQMEKLQYISQGKTRQEQELNIRKALDHGIQWVQVRWKNAPDEELILLCETSRFCVQNIRLFALLMTM